MSHVLATMNEAIITTQINRQDSDDRNNKNKDSDDRNNNNMKSLRCFR